MLAISILISTTRQWFSPYFIWEKEKEKYTILKMMYLYFFFYDKWNFIELIKEKLQSGEDTNYY